jgi:hypothetical protein
MNDEGLKNSDFHFTCLYNWNSDTTVEFGHDSQFLSSLTAQDLDKVSAYTEAERQARIPKVIQEKLSMAANSQFVYKNCVDGGCDIFDNGNKILIKTRGHYQGSNVMSATKTPGEYVIEFTINTARNSSAYYGIMYKEDSLSSFRL